MINYFGIHCHDEIKKSLNTSKGSSEAVNRRRTDNTMATQETGEKDKQCSSKLYTEH